MKKELSLTVVLLPILLFILSSTAQASEGVIYLDNQDNTNAECYALSVLMPSLNYEILMTCRNITYPGDVNQFNYVAWAEPSDGGNPKRLGTIGVGKVQFDMRESFSRIFVTREGSSNPRNPGTNIVMSGNVEDVPRITTRNSQQPQPAQERPSQTPTPSPATQQSGSFISRLFQPGRIILFVGVIMLLVLVFILTRR